MEITLRIVGLLVLLTLPLLLAVASLIQSRQQSPKALGRVLLAIGVLSSWFLLAAFIVVKSTGVGGRITSTHTADVLLLVTLLLTCGSAFISNGSWKLLVASVVLTCFWWLTEQNSALSDSGSSLGLHMSSVAERAGRAPGRNSFEVLHKMNSYYQRGMYDSAIRAELAGPTLTRSMASMTKCSSRSLIYF
jgi:hypothetical protein